jgi:hypothetical protein
LDANIARAKEGIDWRATTGDVGTFSSSARCNDAQYFYRRDDLKISSDTLQIFTRSTHIKTAESRPNRRLFLRK